MPGVDNYFSFHRRLESRVRFILIFIYAFLTASREEKTGPSERYTENNSDFVDKLSLWIAG